MSTAPTLRQLLDAPGMVIAPGAYDAIGARLIEQAGFDVVYMTGGVTSMAHGYPDFGLLDFGEMVANAGRIARATKLPVIADADTGYGNELNVVRTVREYEMRGVAGIHIEDQVSPKRCGHLEGKEVVPQAEFVSKIRAAVEARRSRNFIIIARTDARAVHGMDAAVERMNAALAAGADLAFVEAMQSLDEVAEVPRRVQGPCLLNVVAGGKTPINDMREARAMGYKLVILPALVFMPAMEAADDVLRQFKQTGIAPEARTSIGAVFRRFGADEWDTLRQRYGAGAAATAADVAGPV